MDLQNLLDVYNGTAFLEAGTVEWGYVEPEWYLAVPRNAGQLLNHKYELGTTPFIDDNSRDMFINANFHKLRRVLDTDDKAFFGAFLRYHIVNAGMFSPKLEDRKVKEDEYEYMELKVVEQLIVGEGEQKTEKPHIEPKVPIINSANSITRFVKKYGDSLVHMMVYVFSARGHHWQERYDELYDRLMRVCMIEKPTTWQLPNNREIFRQIMHCFGVYLPRVFTEECVRTGRVAQPMFLRFSPHAPIAGVAVALTSNAILDYMEAELWWKSYDEKFTQEVQAIREEKKRIAIKPYEYHVASKVLAGCPQLKLSENFTKAFNRISQHLLGFVDNLGKRHTLSGQMSVTSHAHGMTKLGENFSRACDKLNFIDISNMDMSNFIECL